MINYNNLLLPELLDLLAIKTKRLSEFIANRQFEGEEYTGCRNEIREIQLAILEKQKNAEPPTISGLNSDRFNIAI